MAHGVEGREMRLTAPSYDPAPQRHINVRLQGKNRLGSFDIGSRQTHHHSRVIPMNRSDQLWMLKSCANRTAKKDTLDTLTYTGLGYRQPQLSLSHFGHTRSVHRAATKTSGTLTTLSAHETAILWAPRAQSAVAQSAVLYSRKLGPLFLSHWPASRIQLSRSGAFFNEEIFVKAMQQSTSDVSDHALVSACLLRPVVPNLSGKQVPRQPGSTRNSFRHVESARSVMSVV